MNKLSALIIGGGIHGLTSAISLAKEGFDVIILEKNNEIMQGTSGATHNRAHLGFHYPRSIDTAIECIKGLRYFAKEYPESLVYIPETYYLIEKKSKISFDEYKNFCDKIKSPYEVKLPPEKFINTNYIANGVKVPEPIFHIEKLTNVLIKKSHEQNISIKRSSEVIEFNKTENKYNLICIESNKRKIYTADIILNATYAYSNNILKILDLKEDMTEYYLQHTEIAVMKSKNPLPSLTVMDGKFFSIMNYASEESNLYLLYDPKYSILEQKKGYFLKEKVFNSNLKKMIKHGSIYFPFLKELKYVESWYGTRPVPVKAVGDSRKTRIKSHTKHPGIYSILEGKFISAPLIARDFVSLLKEEEIIK